MNKIATSICIEYLVYIHMYLILYLYICTSKDADYVLTFLTDVGGHPNTKSCFPQSHFYATFVCERSVAVGAWCTLHDAAVAETWRG